MVQLVMIAWSNVTGTQYLMPIHREHDFTISVTIGAVVNIIANIVLISKYGANGAAVATVISEFSVTAVQLWYIRGTISRRKMFAPIWRYLVSGFFMYLVVSRIDKIMNMSIINLAIQVLIGVVVYAVLVIVLHAPIVDQAKKMLSQK